MKRIVTGFSLAVTLLLSPSLAVGQASADADEIEIYDALDRELERAGDINEVDTEGSTDIVGDDQSTDRLGDEEEVVIEQSVEYETAPMRLPGADELMSGTSSRTSLDEKPRAPRAVVKKRQTTRKKSRVPSTAGVNSSNRLPEPDRTVKGRPFEDDDVAVAGDADSRIWAPVEDPVGVSLINGHRAGDEISVAQLAELDEDEVELVASRGADNVESLSSEIGNSLLDVRTAGRIDPDGLETNKAIQGLSLHVRQLATEIDNLQRIDQRLVGRGVEGVREMRAAMIDAQDQLLRLRAAERPQEFREAADRLESAVQRIDRLNGTLR